MREEIELAPKLKFNALDFACEVVASLGNRGGGKSNGAAVAAEELMDAGVQVIVLDYVSIWSSLRLAPDGETPSRFKIPVLGGPHGDLSLQPGAGALVADALASCHSSAVVDLSSFSKTDRCRFAADFAESFFRAKKKHPGPVQILLEESQRFVPQHLFKGQERMLGAWEEIAEVGRNFGIGLHLISQRPQKISKDVLNLADTVFAYRCNGVLERKAISEWVQEHGAQGRAEVQDQLPSLERGQAIVWSPSRKIFGRYQVRKKSTYDAGATPTHVRADVKTTPIDLGVLEQSMREVVEESRDNDPRVLRGKISRLEAALAESKTLREIVREVEVAPRKLLGEVEGLSGDVGALAASVERVRLDVSRILADLGKISSPGGWERREGDDLGKISLPGDGVRREGAGPVGGDRVPPRPAPARCPPAGLRRPLARPGESQVGNSGLRRMLVALAQCPRGLTSAQVGVRAGISSKSGTFTTYMARARSSGWVVDEGRVHKVTREGIEALGDYETLPAGRELADFWTRELSGGAARMLQAVLRAYPDYLTYEQVGVEANISHRSGTFTTYLSRLRKLELVTGERGVVRASEELFE